MHADMAGQQDLTLPAVQHWGSYLTSVSLFFPLKWGFQQYLLLGLAAGLE